VASKRIFCDGIPCGIAPLPDCLSRARGKVCDEVIASAELALAGAREVGLGEPTDMFLKEFSGFLTFAPMWPWLTLSWRAGPANVVVTVRRNAYHEWSFWDIANLMKRSEAVPIGQKPPRSVAEPFLLYRDGFPSPYPQPDPGPESPLL
jgi:hypothetical protein